MLVDDYFCEKCDLTFEYIKPYMAPWPENPECPECRGTTTRRKMKTKLGFSVPSGRCGNAATGY